MCDHNHNFRREFSHAQATQGGVCVTITITSDVSSLIHRQLRGGCDHNHNFKREFSHAQATQVGGGGAQKVARYQMIGIFVEFFPIL